MTIEPEQLLLDLSEKELVEEIETALPLAAEAMGATRHHAEKALQYICYMGHRFCEIKASLVRKYGRGRFVAYMQAHFDISPMTISRWMNVSKTYSQYLEVEMSNGQPVLSWSSTIPEQIRALSLTRALKVDPETKTPPPIPARPKRNLLEHTMQFRGTLTKHLERKPLDQRDASECYEICASLDPLIKTYEDAKKRCLADEAYKDAF